MFPENVPLTEADKVRVMGITFRSGGHVAWLTLSLAIAALSALVRLAYGDAVPLIGWGGIIVQWHATATLTAFWRTGFGRINGRIWSRDCIWFNALMAYLNYLILFGFR